MTKILIDRAVVEQALEAMQENWRTDKSDASITALRAALAEPDHIPDAGKMVAEPCEMGAMCLNCQPRGPNGECPDAPQPEREPVEATPYNLKRIAWELERTALGDGFYGNALRVAKDMPGITMEDRSVLDRYATSTQTGTDHVHLQWLAQWLYNKDERAPEAPQLKAEQPAEQESVQDEYNRVINHAIEQGIEASVFLHCWRAGDWSGCAEFGFEPNMAAYTAPQPAKPAEQPQEPSAGGVLFAVEQAIRNGDCPWQIEQAFDEYEVERRNSIKE